MDVALKGSSPGAVTAAILLLSRARQLGLPLFVSVVGDPTDVVEVPGPALLYAPVLASCGVGRQFGQGATVVLPGAPGTPLRMSATPHGTGSWFEVTRTGDGCHPATQAFVRMSRDPRVEARHLSKQVRRGMEALGLSPEPAVLDILFGADVPPLLRLALALRAGRALSGGRGEPITRYLTGHSDPSKDPLPADADADEVIAQVREGQHAWIFDGLALSVRDHAESWVETALKLAEEDDGRDQALLHALLELASHLVQLPPHSILPPLGAAEDSVAVGVKSALAANGDGKANRQLVQTFEFLGGRFVSEAEHAYTVCDAPPPADDDPIARWQWFSLQARLGRKRAEALWSEILDPPQ